MTAPTPTAIESFYAEACRRYSTDGFASLTSPQQFAISLLGMLTEVNNGGIHSYITSLAGDHLYAALAALQAIGAERAHDLLDRALVILGPERYSPNRATRLRLILSDDAGEEDRQFAALEPLSRELQACVEQIGQQLDAYILRDADPKSSNQAMQRTAGRAAF